MPPCKSPNKRMYAKTAHMHMIQIPGRSKYENPAQASRSKNGRICFRRIGRARKVNSPKTTVTPKLISIDEKA
ncbi:hypothetical protein K443DRAFT_592011 [Laccaria amethystina LaAM-08-1]|uniref:Uncharacterized protein n=1 Tax=Laccaria amethystina LaAM-08-1 TaxID=1095629 RepID=A0A0C9WR69_9AGAR|nr:hypothetical protein K443DRAFT_592011 [Laccaria amethystina LaAM-08-1]